MTVMMGRGDDRRLVSRVARSGLPADLSGRIRPGYAMRIVDLSARGALLESSRRLLPGSRVDVLIECGAFRHHTRATVVRCHVGVLLPHTIVFRAAIEFDRQLERWCAEPEPVRGGSVDPVVLHPMEVCTCETRL